MSIVTSDAAGTEGREASVDLRALSLDDLEVVSEVPSVSGIYAYLSGGTPLYIGHSVDMRRRQREHARDRKKASWFPAIDEVRILRLEGGKDPRLVAECGLLLKYRPRYNRTIKIGIANDGHLYELSFVRAG
jgi:hypothetical protein